MSESYVAALLTEREAIARTDKRARLAAIDAELARFGVAVDDSAPVVETAAAAPAAALETADAAPAKGRRRS